MKNKYLFLIITVILFSFLSCSKKEEKISNQPVVSASDVDKLKSAEFSGGKAVLKYKFEKGEKIRYKLTSFSTSEQTIKADSTVKSVGNQSLTYFFDVEVLEVDQDKIAELSVNIDQIIYDGNANGQKFHYDSKANITPEEKNKYIDFETIVNTPFRERVNQKGEILEVTRLDKMVDKMISLQSDLKKMTSEQKSNLIKNIGEAELKPRTQLLFRELTSKEIGKDSIWQKDTPATLMVFQLDNIITYKVKDFVKVGDDNAVKLSADLSVKWSGEKKVTNNGMNYQFDDPKVTGGGMILFDIDKGKVLRAETTTNIEMGVQVSAKDSSQKMKKTFRKDLSTNKNVVELL